MTSRSLWPGEWRRIVLRVSVVVVALFLAACEQPQEPRRATEKPAPTAQPQPAPGAAALREFAHEISSSAPLQTIRARETRTMPVTVKNVSKESWPASGEKPVRVSYRWVDQTGKVLGPGLRTPLPHDVAPGESISLAAKIRGPAEAGEYTLRLTLMQERVAWFGARGAQPLKIPVTVTAREPATPAAQKPTTTN